MKETKIERDSLKNAFRKIVKRDVRYKLDLDGLNKNIKLDKKGNAKYKLLRNWNYIKNNDDKNSQNQELWFEIPREYKKNDIIFKAHTTGGSHLAVKRTLEEIMKLGYRWEGIEKDVREFFFKWEVWQGRTKNPQKQTYNHYIETTHPRERYQMDLVQWSDYLWDSEEKELLNEELKVEKAERDISDEEIESIFKDKKYRKKQEKKEIRGPILLTIIDHFSKYGWIYCIPDKSMDTVFLKIKQAFAQFMPPKILHTDNGAEFKNKLIKSYWEGKGINFVNGTPGHPQSQGAIEAFNKTVQNFLILAKDAQKDKFNLEHSIADFLMYYNQRKHTTTKHSPIEIMSNVNDEKLLDEVRENTKKSRKHSKNESIIFSKEKKILISNWIKIDDKNFCIYSSSKPTIKSKSFAKQSWFIKGKVIEEKRDYCKIEIQENKSEHKSIQKGSVLKVHKHAIKPCNR